jgi:hypothetical protein
MERESDLPVQEVDKCEEEGIYSLRAFLLFM